VYDNCGSSPLCYQLVWTDVVYVHSPTNHPSLANRPDSKPDSLSGPVDPTGLLQGSRYASVLERDKVSRPGQLWASCQGIIDFSTSEMKPLSCAGGYIIEFPHTAVVADVGIYARACEIVIQNAAMDSPNDLCTLVIRRGQLWASCQGIIDFSTAEMKPFSCDWRLHCRLYTHGSCSRCWNFFKSLRKCTKKCRIYFVNWSIGYLAILVPSLGTIRHVLSDDFVEDTNMKIDRIRDGLSGRSIHLGHSAWSIMGVMPGHH
jgi:hypothetical protein